MNHLGVFPRLLLATAVGLVQAGGSGAASAAVDDAIGRLRMGTMVITTEPGAEVHVEQLQHQFWFGAALASQMLKVSFTGTAQ